MMRGGVVERLDAVVDIDGDRSGDSGKITADHQHDAEFAERVRKAEHQRSEKAGPREREDDAEKCAGAIRAEDGGGIEQASIERFKGSDERLHGKWQAVEHGGEHESGKGKGERMAEKQLPKFTKRAARTHSNERVKPEDGRREHEWQRDDGFEQKFSAPHAEGQTVRERKSEHKKKEGDSRGEAEREEECFDVHGFCPGAVKEDGAAYP